MAARPALRSRQNQEQPVRRLNDAPCADVFCRSPTTLANGNLFRIGVNSATYQDAGHTRAGMAGPSPSRFPLGRKCDTLVSRPTSTLEGTMQTTTLIRSDEMPEVIARLASEIIARHPSGEQLVLLGIQRRGVDIAVRLAAVLEARLAQPVPLGSLDINLYRDDWTSSRTRPVIGTSHLPAPLDARDVILVDDVLFTGRTVRAALEAILDYGRPRKVELLVLVDRGHRELPIHADYTGRLVHTERDDQVNVLMRERDGRDEVRLQRGNEDA